jgi:hypothetical protein
MKEISPERKALYHVGMALGLLGFCMFISAFFVREARPLSSANVDAEILRRVARGERNIVIGAPGPQKTIGEQMGMRAIPGMLICVAGFVLMGIGSSGVAGAGLVLDPQKAAKRAQILEPAV